MGPPSGPSTARSASAASWATWSGPTSSSAPTTTRTPARSTSTPRRATTWAITTTPRTRGARYTVLFGLEQDSASRLLCRLHTRQRDRAPVDLEVATEPGSMVIFNGDKVYHGVSPAR